MLTAARRRSRHGQTRAVVVRRVARWPCSCQAICSPHAQLSANVKRGDGALHARLAVALFWRRRLGRHRRAP